MMLSGYRTAMNLSTLIPINKLFEAIRSTYLLKTKTHLILNSSLTTQMP